MRAGQCLLAAFLLAGLLASTACTLTSIESGDRLDGTSWVLIAYGQTAPIAGTTITASFEDGRVFGSSGCNTYSGTYKSRGDKLEISGLAWTLMACLGPEGVMDQERHVMSTLGDARDYQIAEGQLRIFPSAGEALTFIPQD